MQMTACEETNYDSCYAEGGVVYEGCAAACADEACAEGVETFLRGQGGLRARIRVGGILRHGPGQLLVLP